MEIHPQVTFPSPATDSREAGGLGVLPRVALGVVLSVFGLGAASSFAGEPVRVIVDADTANEIDDLYAIVRALVAPEFRVKGVT